MALVRVVGAGPAGSSAALAALSAGAEVEIFEKSPFPRHKVCGEFLSPETVGVLEGLGLGAKVASLAPARMTQMTLHFGDRRRSAAFPAPALGLSRYRMDEMLLSEAMARGAVLRREHAERGDVIAVGRKASAARGNRLFGFKAHFEGPANDVMELYFLPGYSYVGVNAIEGGRTNVCGLASEAELKECGFRVDEYVARHRPLADRIRNLTRVMEWLIVGPLVFGNRLRQEAAPGEYVAGDLLSFVDPFTGSGILAALLTGSLAGRAAALQLDPKSHVNECRLKLERAFRAATVFRTALQGNWGHLVAPWLPPRMLFQITRPR